MVGRGQTTNSTHRFATERKSGTATPLHGVEHRWNTSGTAGEDPFLCFNQSEMLEQRKVIRRRITAASAACFSSESRGTVRTQETMNFTSHFYFFHGAN